MPRLNKIVSVNKVSVYSVLTVKSNLCSPSLLYL